MGSTSPFAVDIDRVSRLGEPLVGGKATAVGCLRSVWASLWSDAALLYRRELSLNPLTSSMAVLVQEFVESDVSGVAFSDAPMNTSRQTAFVEAVSGHCSDLVN